MDEHEALGRAVCDAAFNQTKPDKDIATRIEEYEYIDCSTLEAVRYLLNNGWELIEQRTMEQFSDNDWTRSLFKRQTK